MVQLSSLGIKSSLHPSLFNRMTRLEHPTTLRHPSLQDLMENVVIVRIEDTYLVSLLRALLLVLIFERVYRLARDIKHGRS